MNMYVASDDLGKQFRGRLKGSIVTKIGPTTFTKVELVSLLAHTKVVNSADEAD